MTIHKSQLFWCEQKGKKVLTHCQLFIFFQKQPFPTKKSDVQTLSGLVTRSKNLQDTGFVGFLHFDQTTARHGQVLSRENLNFIFQELKQKGGSLVFLVFLLLWRGIFGDDCFSEDINRKRNRGSDKRICWKICISKKHQGSAADFDASEATAVLGGLPSRFFSILTLKTVSALRSFRGTQICPA